MKGKRPVEINGIDSNNPFAFADAANEIVRRYAVDEFEIGSELFDLFPPGGIEQKILLPSLIMAALRYKWFKWKPDASELKVRDFYRNVGRRPRFSLGEGINNRDRDIVNHERKRRARELNDLFKDRPKPPRRISL